MKLKWRLALAFSFISCVYSVTRDDGISEVVKSYNSSQNLADSENLERKIFLKMKFNNKEEWKMSEYILRLLNS